MFINVLQQEDTESKAPAEHQWTIHHWQAFLLMGMPCSKLFSLETDEALDVPPDVDPPAASSKPKPDGTAMASKPGILDAEYLFVQLTRTKSNVTYLYVVF